MFGAQAFGLHGGSSDLVTIRIESIAALILGAALTCPCREVLGKCPGPASRMQGLRTYHVAGN